MQKVRVLQVNKLYPPWVGGVESAVQQLAEAFCESHDFEMEVLVCQPKGPDTHHHMNGVPVHRVRSCGMAFSMPLAPHFPAILERMAAEFAIVHVHVPFPLPMFCNWPQLKRTGVRLVVHYHSDIVRPLQKRLLSGLRHWNTRFMEAADRIIVTSEALLKHSAELAPHREKCWVVPLFIDLHKVTIPAIDDIVRVRCKYGLSDKERVILFAGRLVYYKGLEHLIDAVRTLDARLLIVGDGPLGNSLRERVRKLRIENKVLFLGRVEDAELSILYSLADVFVLPSTEVSEAFGIVQLEAMARGLPVVNTSLPTGVPSVSIDGVTGLTVPPGNAALLRDAINTILSNEELRRRFSWDARRRVQRFSRPVVMDEIKAIYREVIESGTFAEPWKVPKFYSELPVMPDGPEYSTALRPDH